ncbi:sensor histidine kinase [Ructibacterium gallinarum]|uniref:histidine kinase n=1 Tax=Ructibacterium gallinarum TaxID=2779355 RepID=A0A9D5R875_9FIRM|nr:ATP-binding protein [Ructibacterium gallinarum]MBE5039672.1 histidine kinase [Ructibacterium gallinarum]
MTKRIFRSIFFVAAVVLIAGFALIMGTLYRYFDNQLHKELQNEAEYLSTAVEQLGVTVLKELGPSQERVTLIDQDGTVLFDNLADQSSMDNHSGREEIQAAMANGSGSAVRYSKTLSERTLYYALRLENGQVLRVSSTQYTILSLIGSMIYPVLLIFILLIVLSGIFASRASKKIVKPINELDLEHPMDDEKVYDEIAPLLSKIGHQSRTIQRQIAGAKHQQEEFALITENMQEGLLVIDKNTILLSWNGSALKLLDAAGIRENQSVLVLNRSEQFQNVVTEALNGHHASTVLNIQNRYCQVAANPVIWDKDPEGAVLLLIDVTETTERECLRREFTANVSHELKTPLTSISGFAEIMKDGMVKKEDIQKFASKIFEEAQRLIVLVEDIIKISQLDEGRHPYEYQDIDLYTMSGEILDRLKSSAEKNNIQLKLEGVHAVIHSAPVILDEIIYNLCDNAVKYNHPHGKVIVTVFQDKTQTSVQVADTGIGIPSSDQERIFERFYRVDKSHSKEIGGTGLGLSIVKHGAAYLGAEINCESTLGQGSIFTLIWKNN